MSHVMLQNYLKRSNGNMTTVCQCFTENGKNQPELENRFRRMNGDFAQLSGGLHKSQGDQAQYCNYL
jgi:hypothetical protein